jgi:hypothetical protein
LDTKIANAVGYLTGILLKAFEVGEVERRLEALEEVMNERPDPLGDSGAEKQHMRNTKTVRLDKLETSLTPRETVQLWLKDALQHDCIIEAWDFGVQVELRQGQGEAQHTIAPVNDIRSAICRSALRRKPCDR